MDSFRPKIILVATDLSDSAAQALRYASAIADRNGARLVAIYADELIPPLGEPPAATRQAAMTAEELVAFAHEQLVAQVEENISPYVPFIARVCSGAAADAIADEAKEYNADLIVVGTHGRSGFRRLLVGSVCEAVLRKASVPVLTVSTLAAMNPAMEMKKIICVVDFTPECADALRVAASLASDARLVLVKPDEGRNLRDSDRLTRLQRWLPAELADRCELRLAGAFTPEHVARFAALVRADLVAAGLTETRGIAGALLGSTTDRIVQHSECPVLVVNANAVREQEVRAGAGCPCDA